MSTEALEKKVAELTARVEQLEKKRAPVAKPTWREIIGKGTDNELSREAARLGEEWRRSEGIGE